MRIRHFLMNLPVLLSGVAWATLCMFPFRSLYPAYCLLIAALFALAFKVENFYGFWKQQVSKVCMTVSALIIMVELVVLCYRTHFSSYAAWLDRQLGGIHESYIEAVVLLGLAVVSFYFLSGLLAYFWNACNQTADDTSSFLSDARKIRRNRIILRILIFLGICSLVGSSLTYYAWGDPIASLALVRLSYADMMKFIVADVHPPLYYFILKIAEDILSFVSGDVFYQIVVGKLVSIVPVFLAVGLCWRKLSNGCHNPYLREVIALCFLATPMALNYGVEVRMYSWALFFLTGAYLYARDIMHGQRGVKSWCWLTVFSLACAYTHNLALVGMAAIWLLLIIWIIANDRKLLKAYVVAGTVVALIYLPWMNVLLRQTAYITEGSFWVPPMSKYAIFDFIWGCVQNSHHVGILSGLTFVVMVMVAGFAWKQYRMGKLLVADIAGILIPFIVLFVAFAVSILYRPILVHKYLLPCTFCMWICVALLWSKMKSQASSLLLCVLAIAAVGASFDHALVAYRRGGHSQKLADVLRSLEKDAVVYVEDNEYRLGGYRIIGYFVDNEIVTPPAPHFLPLDLWKLLYPSLSFVETPTDEVLQKLLAEGRSVYYFAWSPVPGALREIAEFTYVDDIGICHEWHHDGILRYAVYRLNAPKG